MISRTRVSAGLLATVAAVGGAMVALDRGPGSTADGLPAAPPLLEMSALEPIVPDDGLERLVVTIPTSTAEVRGDRNPSPEPSDDGDATNRSDPSSGGGLIGALPDEAKLIVISDGRLGYLDEDRNFIPFDADSDASEDGKDGGDVEPTTLDTLAGLPGVESVEPISEGSFAVRTSEPGRVEELADLGVTVSEEMFLVLTSDPYEPYQWSIDNTGTNLDGVSSLPNVEQSPDADVDGIESRLGATGRGVVVAIVDSGVDLSHPELAHAAWVNPGEDCDSGGGNGVDDDGNGYIDDCSGWDFGDNDRQTFDGSNNAHGTHVAGIIAARADNDQGMAGIAPDADIMDLKVSDRSGAIPSSSIARAIRYAVDNGADVVNLSLGSQPGAPPASAAELASAVEYARLNGVLLVVAAGNNGISLDSAPGYPASLNTSNMLVVGASDPTDHPASFSNFGSAVDLFAPGLYILSTTPNSQLAFQSGTSQASPVVAGAAALAVESLGTSGPAAVIDRLTASADSLPQLHRKAANPLRVNAARAVGVAVGTVGPSDGAGDSGGSAGSVGSVTVRGLAGDDTGQVSASMAIVVEDDALDQPFRWEASLFALEGGRLFAIPDHEVIAGPTDAAQAVTTNDRGSVFLAESDHQSAQWDTVLPGGTYALLIEAVPESDPELRLGDGFLATFAVAGPPDDGTGTDDGTGSGSGGNPADDSTSGGTDDGSGGSDEAGTNDDGTSTDGTTDGPGVGTTPGSGSTAADSGGDDTAGTTDSGQTSSGSDGGASGSAGGSSGTSDGGTDDPSVDNTGGQGSPDGPDADPGTGSGDSGGGSTGPPAGSGSGSNGDWSVVEISPPSGFVDSFNIVYVFGSFAEPVTVWFGESAARTVTQSESLLIVQTDRHGRAGPVDVSLRRQTDELLRLPDAYTFVPLNGGTAGGGVDDDPDSGSGSSGTDDGTPVGDSGGAVTGGTGDDDGSGSPGGGTDGSTGDDSGGDGSIGDDSGGDGPTVDDSRGRGNARPRPRASLNGEPIELSNGLIGVPVRGVHVVGPIPSCGIDACRARRI